MAAALPGVVAAYCELPVIGVPIAAGGLNGMDALLAIVQMPPGVPVGCMAVGGARNAAIFASHILAQGGTPVVDGNERVRHAERRRARSRWRPGSSPSSGATYGDLPAAVMLSCRGARELPRAAAALGRGLEATIERVASDVLPR